MDILLLTLGFIILILVFFDFFHTTLSGKGFWYISAGVNGFFSWIILKNQNRKFFDFSGLIHILATALTWLILLVIGNYLIFISYDLMVIHGATKVPANLTERFYYTCYLLSTLGIGDFVPGNTLSRILTGLLSFSGFILLTTALTYLLSVVNSVLSKRQLAFTISTLGNNIEELHYFLQLEGAETLADKSGDLRQQVLKNSSNFLAFPIINHFMTRYKSRSAEIQLARLYEVLMVLSTEYEKGTTEFGKISKIINAVEVYLSLGLSDEENFDHAPDRLAELRQFWTQRGKKIQQNSENDRRINASLNSAGWTWDDVYTLED